MPARGGRILFRLEQREPPQQKMGRWYGTTGGRGLFHMERGTPRTPSQGPRALTIADAPRYAKTIQDLIRYPGRVAPESAGSDARCHSRDGRCGHITTVVVQGRVREVGVSGWTNGFTLPGSGAIWASYRSPEVESVERQTGGPPRRRGEERIDGSAFPMSAWQVGQSLSRSTARMKCCTFHRVAEPNCAVRNTIQGLRRFAVTPFSAPSNAP